MLQSIRLEMHGGGGGTISLDGHEFRAEHIQIGQAASGHVCRIVKLAAPESLHEPVYLVIGDPGFAGMSPPNITPYPIMNGPTVKAVKEWRDNGNDMEIMPQMW